MIVPFQQKLVESNIHTFLRRYRVTCTRLFGPCSCAMPPCQEPDHNEPDRSDYQTEDTQCTSTRTWLVSGEISDHGDDCYRRPQTLSPQCADTAGPADPKLTSMSVRGRAPVLSKQSVVPGQLSTGTGGQFEAGVNSHTADRERAASAGRTNPGALERSNRRSFF